LNIKEDQNFKYKLWYKHHLIIQEVNSDY
jgi:hypothetical protein